MATWLVILYNLAILGTWGYLIYLVYNLDPKIRSEWKGTTPVWSDEYDSFINAVKRTSIVNGALVLLTIITVLYKKFAPNNTSPVGARRR